MISKIKYILMFLFLIIIIALCVRGLPGNPKEEDLLQNKWRADGPFELSPERGRFAITYSLAETKSVYFPVDIARFVVPDLGYVNGHYVSLFAPLVSFVVLPGYIIGKLLGASQVGTFSVISLFGIANFWLIYLIAKKIGAGSIPSIIAGIIFLFASPAFAYAVDLYQHHITTFIILLSIYILSHARKVWHFFALFFLYALGLSLDYPNIFLMFPVMVFTGLSLFEVSKSKYKINIKLNLIKILGVFGVVIPITFFLWFNNASYGSPFTTLGNSKIISVKDIDKNGNPAIPEEKKTIENLQNTVQESTSGIFSYFNTRNFINGFYILLFSPDRGVLVFTPVIFFGILGLIYLIKQNEKYTVILASIFATNLILYAMWGDPSGGWAFGARYLIPSYAILSIFIATVLSKYRKYILFLIPFYLILVYSIAANTLGALTTSAMPPQVESQSLSQLSGREEKYSVDRNWEFINSGKSKSFIFQAWAHNFVTANEYYYIIAGSIILLSSSLLIANILKKDEK